MKQKSEFYSFNFLLIKYIEVLHECSSFIESIKRVVENK